MSSNEDATIGVKRSSDVIENEEHEDTIPKKVATLVSAAAPNVTADADTATYMIKVLCPEPAVNYLCYNRSMFNNTYVDWCCDRKERSRATGNDRRDQR